MAVVKIELELDWLGEDGNVDEVIKKKVIDDLQSRLISNVEKSTENMLKVKLAKVADRVTDEFLSKVMSDSLESMTIQHKKDYWDSRAEEISLSKFVGMKYESFIKEKTLDERGNANSREAKYTIAEYLTQQYLAKELTAKVSKLIQQARQDAENGIIKTLEQNLKDQLGADMISRLNIPQMLKALQEKAAELQSGREAAPDA